MPDDFRIAVGWRRHPKRRRLLRALGPAAVIALEDLWAFCTESRTDGDLRGLSAADIADAADYVGDGEAWVKLLATPFADGGCGLLDGKPGAFRVHDWEEINPYVAGHERRSKSAKIAAAARWADAERPKPHRKRTATRNAPSGSDPIHPDPSPDPIPKRRVTPAPEKKPVADAATRGKLTALVAELGRKKSAT